MPIFSLASSQRGWQRGLETVLLMLLLWMSAALWVNSAWAASAQAVRELEAQTQQQAVYLQQQVEALAEQRRQDFEQWRQLRRQWLLLEAHNARQAAWNARLHTEILNLQAQLDSLDATRDTLEPLMLAMLERLAALIQHDLPFQQAQRLQHVHDLHRLLQRVDVSHAEKLRHLLLAYRQEIEQGRMLKTSREWIYLDADHSERVLLMRMGRIGLYFLSEDQQRAGVWLAAEQRWQPLNTVQRASLQTGLALAEERGLPELLHLPLSIPLRSAQESGSL